MSDPVMRATRVLETTNKPQGFKERLEEEAPELLLHFGEVDLAIEFYGWLKEAWAENKQHSYILSKDEIPNRWFKLVRSVPDATTGGLVLKSLPLFNDEPQGPDMLNTAAADEISDEEDVRMEVDDADAAEVEGETEDAVEPVVKGKDRMDVDEEETHEAPVRARSTITTHQPPGVNAGFGENDAVKTEDEHEKEDEKAPRTQKAAHELFCFPPPQAHNPNRRLFAYKIPDGIPTTPYTAGRRTFNTDPKVPNQNKKTRADYNLPLPANVFESYLRAHQQRQVNYAYRRTWMNDNHIRAEAAEVGPGSLMMLSKMKMEEMPAQGILIDDDDFFMKYKDGGVDREVTATLKGLTSDKRSILEFNGFVDEEGHPLYALCKGPAEVVKAFMHLQDKIHVDKPIAGSWKAVYVRHGNVEFGSLHRMRQEYELFKLEMDDWAEQAGAEWRKKKD